MLFLTQNNEVSDCDITTYVAFEVRAKLDL